MDFAAITLTQRAPVLQTGALFLPAMAFMSALVNAIHPIGSNACPYGQQKKASQEDLTGFCSSSATPKGG